MTSFSFGAAHWLENRKGKIDRTKIDVRTNIEINCDLKKKIQIENGGLSRWWINKYENS